MDSLLLRLPAIVCFLATVLIVRAEPVEIVVGATDSNGLPVENVSFVFQSLEGRELSSGATDTFGQVSFYLDHPTSSALVLLDDPKYISMAESQQSDPGSRRIPFRLFNSDVSKMNRSERQEYALLWPTMLEQSSGPSTPRDSLSHSPHLAPRHLMNFIGPNRQESDQIEVFENAEESETAIQARVVDHLGQPVLGVRGYLFSYDEAEEEAQITGYERTSEDGTINYSNIPTGRFYRIELESNDGRLGRSNLIFVDQEREHSLPSIILRGPNQGIDGFLYHGDAPAAGAVVEVMFEDRGSLTASTDEYGYFEIFPINTSPVDIQFTRTTDAGTKSGTLTVAPGPYELMVPFHILAP